MATLGMAWVTLGVNDRGLRSGLASAKGMVVGAIASINGAFASGMASNVKALVNTVEEYKQSTINIAATLTDLADKSSGDVQKIYANNLAYAKDVYTKVEAEAAKHFATGAEMVQAWTLLTQKGVVLSSDADIESLGIIVDKIKLVTQGQSSSVQIAQELRAVMDGVANQHSQIAKDLQSRFGPAWKDMVEEAKQLGTVMQLIASVYSGMKVASKDIQGTVTSQINTMTTYVTAIGRQGIEGGFYQDIVKILQDANAYLIQHRALLSGEIYWAYKEMGISVEGVGKALAVAATRVMEIGLTLTQMAVPAIKDFLEVANAIVNVVHFISDGFSQVDKAIRKATDGSMSLAQTLFPGLKLAGMLAKEVNKEWDSNNAGPSTAKPKPAEDLSGYTTPVVKLPKIDLPSAGGSLKRVLGLDDIDQMIDRLRQKMDDVGRSYADMTDDLMMQQLRNQGLMLDAELYGIDKKSRDHIAGIDKALAQAETAYRELQQKVNNAAGGATAEAKQAVEDARKMLQIIQDKSAAEKIAAEQLRQAEREKMSRDTYQRGAVDLAQTNLEYLTLTGTIREQEAAKVALIQATLAEKLANTDLNIPGLADAYKRLAEEQMRIAEINANGSVWDQMVEGAKKAFKSTEAAIDQWARIFSDLKGSVKDIFKGLITGAEDMQDRIANALEKLGENLMDLALNDVWNMLAKKFKDIGGSGGGGGIGDIFGGIWGWIGGLFGGGKASGGSVSSGMAYLVGERGPELFVPGGAGYIVPNGALAGGPTLNVPTPEIRIYSSDPNTRVSFRWRESSGQQRAKAARTMSRAQRDV